MADQTILQETLDNAIVDGDYLIYWKTATSVQRRVARSSLIGATLTGAGTIATGGFTATVPATGTVALRDVANTFTAAQTVTVSSNGAPLSLNGNGGYGAHWAHSGVSTTVTIIADGAGDVVGKLAGHFVLEELDGGSPTGNTASGDISITPGNTQELCNFTARTCVLAVAANGSVTIYRGAGARTYRVSLWLIWV